MQPSNKKLNRLIAAIAPSGNLFFLVTAQELRRQGLSFLAFYVLQRTIEERGISELTIRAETGFPDYEVSRACKLLVDSGLVKSSRWEKDSRIRLLDETSAGRKIQTRVLLAASKRLAEGIPVAGRLRRISEATGIFGRETRCCLARSSCPFSIPICSMSKASSRRSAKRRRPRRRYVGSEPYLSLLIRL